MKKLLAIDTSTEQASVAVMVDGVVRSKEQGSQKTHARVLLPLIDQLMTEANLPLNQLEGIVFGCGPGSFTGLRIACSIAKGLAYALDIPLIPVSSLAAITYAVREQQHTQDAVLAVLDARMQELYWGYFAPNQLIAEDRISAVQNIDVPQDQSIILAGHGIDLYWASFPKELKQRIRDHYRVVPAAAAMISLAIQAKIHPVSVKEAQPVYVRNQVTR